MIAHPSPAQAVGDLADRIRHMREWLADIDCPKALQASFMYGYLREELVNLSALVAGDDAANALRTALTETMPPGLGTPLPRLDLPVPWVDPVAHA